MKVGIAVTFSNVGVHIIKDEWTTIRNSCLILNIYLSRNYYFISFYLNVDKFINLIVDFVMKLFK